MSAAASSTSRLANSPASGGGFDRPQVAITIGLEWRLPPARATYGSRTSANRFLHDPICDFVSAGVGGNSRAETRQPPYESNASNLPAAECVPSLKSSPTGWSATELGAGLGDRRQIVAKNRFLHDPICDFVSAGVGGNSRAETRQPPYESNASNLPAAECVPSLKSSPTGWSATELGAGLGDRRQIVAKARQTPRV